jgi:uncharacterized protein Yka (UPF0111/DUF47 family)
MKELINTIDDLVNALKAAYRSIEQKDKEIAELKEQLHKARQSAIKKYEYQRLGA